MDARWGRNPPGPRVDPQEQGPPKGTDGPCVPVPTLEGHSYSWFFCSQVGPPKRIRGCQAQLLPCVIASSLGGSMLLESSLRGSDCREPGPECGQTEFLLASCLQPGLRESYPEEGAQRGSTKALDSCRTGVPGLEQPLVLGPLFFISAGSVPPSWGSGALWSHVWLPKISGSV